MKWYHLPGKRIIGEWTITNNQPASLPALNVLLKEPTGWPSHIDWWNDYWKRSSVSVPDPILERQYYLDMYKFGCVARGNTPPISLQAIWTADDGKLPPWKGDFHHDLNTELSYWPGYSGNHLDLTEGFTNWLWKVKDENKRWTKQYFEVDGLNVPGVTTISGKPMGGWIQYSMSPTTSAWLSHHFYLQARYSNDRVMAKKAYEYLLNTEIFLDTLFHKEMLDTTFTVLGSSPEYNDNSIKAWFKSSSNYDRALIFYLNNAMDNLERIPGGSETHIAFMGELYPEVLTRREYAVNETGLMIAPGQNLEHSHRHQNHLLAIHPIGLLNIEDSAQKIIIDNSLKHIEKLGTRQWVGYSFAWIGSIYARAQNGDSAAVNLKRFATNFVSSNSFHLNGDQRGGEYSDFTYRPFTLEGNFAFAQGIHEMLLQSHKNFIEVFPAIPKEWKNVSFKTLRAEGAFLISAIKEDGVPMEVKIRSETGGILKIKLPFKTWINTGIDRSLIKMVNGIAEMKTSKGQTIVFKNAFE